MIKVLTADDYIKGEQGRWVRRGNKATEATGQAQSDVPRVAPLAQLLDAVAAFIRRFVVLQQKQVNAVALWVAHTHAFEAADNTPYLSTTSPEKRSGKTRLLEILELLVNKPWLTVRVTPAVLVRKVDAEKPTLLLDESDAAFKGDKEYSETLRAILNSGHRHGGKASMCVGQGANISYKDLSTFCPKAIAGIGKLPDTVADRSIPIVLKRRSSSEPIERFRRKNVEGEAQKLRESLAAALAGLQLRDAKPELPEELDDRAADGWEPLLAIADAAGGDWPQKARSTAIDLSCGEQREDQSLGTRLLADIKAVFDDQDVDRLPSVELVQALTKLEESPWPALDDRRPLDTTRMARLLRPYEIRPKTIRMGETTPRGYEKEQFADAWNRYVVAPPSDLPKTPRTLDTNQIQTSSRNTDREPKANVAAVPQIQPRYDVAGVAAEKGGTRGRVTSFDSDKDMVEV